MPISAVLEASGHPRGFTLLETLVVVALVALLAAVVGPRVGAGGDGARVRAGVADISRVLADARLVAMRQGEATRVVFDQAGRRIIAADGERIAVAPPMTVEARTDGPRVGGVVALDFFPDGSASEAFISVASGGIRREVHLDGVLGRIERR